MAGVAQRWGCQTRAGPVGGRDGPTPRAGAVARKPRRLRDEAPTLFQGADPGAVEFLVNTVGIRPAAAAATLLHDAQRWAEAQDTSTWADAAEDTPRWSPRVTFQSARAVVRELVTVGVRKKALLDLLKQEPAPLALPQPELSARLDALVDIGVEEAQLAKLLERQGGLRVLRHPVPELHAAAGRLRSLGMTDLSATLVLCPRILTVPEEELVQRVAELAALGPPLQAPAVGMCIQQHPELVLPLQGGCLADRAQFWQRHVGDELAMLAARTPAMLTTSVSVLRKKAALVTGMLPLSLRDAALQCPELFGQVNVDRTLRPRLTFLLALGVPADAVASSMTQWVAPADAEAFLVAATHLAGPAHASQCTPDAWEAHLDGPVTPGTTD